jgi:hypothetical protein
VIGLVGIGGSISLLCKSVHPEELTRFFREHASALTALMASDDAFAVSYAIAFIALALYLMPRERMLAIPVLVLTLATTVVDLMENSMTLAGVAAATQNTPIEMGLPVTLFLMSQMKFLLIYVAGLLIAIGVWGDGTVGRALSVLLVLFVLVGTVSIAVEGLVLVKVAWMFLRLGAGGYFLWRAAGGVTGAAAAKMG